MRRQQYEYYRDKLLTFDNDVKLVKLKDMAEVYDGTHSTPKYVSKGIKFISVENIKDIYSTNKYITSSDYEKYKIKPQINDIFMTRIGSIGDCTVVNREEPLAYYVSLALIRPNQKKVNSTFLKYLIESSTGKKELNKRILFNAVPIKINKNDIGELEFNIPSLEVQQRIVNVLDNFDVVCNDLGIGLPAEIEARQKQYEYYRDLLLTFPQPDLQSLTNERTNERTNDKISIVKLFQYVYGYYKSSLADFCNVTKLAGFEFTKYVKYSDFGKIIALRGLNVKNGILDLNDVKYIDGSDFSKLNRSKLKINDILFTYVGTIGQVALVDKNDKYYLAPNVALIRNNSNNILSKYLIYYMQTNQFLNSQIYRLMSKSSMENLTMEKIRLFKIPIPPLKEQKRIVSILDNFEKICNDLTDGLPKLIDLSQKQYEYYRDKLLSFKKLNS